MDRKSNITRTLRLTHIPLYIQTVAIIDIDSTELSTFDDVDKENLEKIAAILANGCDWGE